MAKSKGSKPPTSFPDEDSPFTPFTDDFSGDDRPEEKAPPKDIPPEDAGAGEPDDPPASGSRTITLKGTGTLSMLFDGEVQQLQRGKKIKVSDALAEALAGETEA